MKGSLINISVPYFRDVCGVSRNPLIGSPCYRMALPSRTVVRVIIVHLPLRGHFNAVTLVTAEESLTYFGKDSLGS